MAELIGLFLIVVCGAFMLNPANPVPDDAENLKHLKKKLQSGTFPIWGNKEQ